MDSREGIVPADAISAFSRSPAGASMTVSDRSPGASELLVVLERQSAQTRERIGAGHRIAQQLSPRLLVVQGSRLDDEARLPAIPGVVEVTTEEPSPAG